MEQVVINQLAARVSQLLEEKLAAKGRTLDKRLAFARRHVPRRVRRAGRSLVEAQNMSQSPVLARRLDSEHVAKSYDTICRYLGELDAKAERSRRRYNALAGVAAQVLLVGICFTGVLAWRGYI
jgi:hypothetical protein